MQAGLRCAIRLSREHDYERALQVLSGLQQAYRLRPEYGQQLERAARHIRDKRLRSEALVREAVARAKEFQQYCSYEKAICVLEQVPARLRTPEAAELLKQVVALRDRVQALEVEVQQSWDAHRLRDCGAAIDRLLTLKPHHESAREIARNLRRKLVAAALGKLRGGDRAAALELLGLVPECERDAQVRRLRDRAQGVARTRAPRPPTAPPLRNADAGKEERIHVVPEGRPTKRRHWLERLEKWNRRCLKSPWFPWACGGYFNLALLLVLAFVLIIKPLRDRPLVLTMKITDDLKETPLVLEPVEEELMEPELTELPTSSATEPLERSPLEVSVPAPLSPLDVIPEAATASLDSQHHLEHAREAVEATEDLTSHQPTVAQRHELRLDPPRHAVTDGNFSVWTEPEIPISGESYEIHIQIRLPDEVTEYPRSDLSGMLLGSDGYRKPLDSASDELVPIIAHTVEIVIPVVGAQRPVGDVVIIRSRLLKAQKVLKLRYDQ